jgi:hypothetical protein
LKKTILLYPVLAAMLLLPVCVGGQTVGEQVGRPPASEGNKTEESLKNSQNVFLQNLQGRWNITQGFNMAHAVIDFYLSDDRVEAGVYTRIASCLPSWASSLKDAWLDYKRVLVQTDGNRLSFQYPVITGNFFNRDKNCLSDTIDAVTSTLNFNLSWTSENVLAGTLQWGNHPPVKVEFQKKH